MRGNAKTFPLGTFSAHLVSMSIRSEAVHRTNKYLALALALIVSAEILAFAWRDSRSPKTALNVQVASARIIMLHISNKGELAIDSQAVPYGHLAGRLREIFGIGAEGFLYLFPENDAPAQRIADVIDVVQRLHSENMNIQIRLVTTGSYIQPSVLD